MRFICKKYNEEFEDWEMYEVKHVTTLTYYYPNNCGTVIASGCYKCKALYEADKDALRCQLSHS